MGILLETAPPNRRFLIRLAVWRFSVSLVFLWITAVHFSRSAFDAPVRWLLLAGLWLSLFLGWLAAGLHPLCFLQRRVEFYENGIAAEPYEIPLEFLDRVQWRREAFRLLGIFPLPLAADRMVCILKPEGRRKFGKRVSVSGFYFAGLRDAFDRAYEFSIPWEFVALRKKRGKRRAAKKPQQQTPIGPAVPPVASPPPKPQEKN